MKKHFFLFLCIFNVSVIFPQEPSLLKKLLFPKEIILGSVLLSAAWYFDPEYIKNECTTNGIRSRTIWKSLSQLEFNCGSPRKEVEFTNDEMKERINEWLAVGESEENYEFYGKNKELIPPASPVLEKKECVNDLSEIRIIHQKVKEKTIIVFEKRNEEKWNRKIIIEVPIIESVHVARLDGEKQRRLLRNRKIVQSVGCACILLGATRSFYNWLNP